MLLKDPLNSTQRRLQAFRDRFGESHLLMSCHAAFPIAITADLLYCIWANFQLDNQGKSLQIPWLAVSDLMLSGLLQEVGHELYEMDQSVRTELLTYLREHPCLGSERIQGLAGFLLAYISHQPKSLDLDDQDLSQAQRWTALAYLQPDQAARELAIALSEAHQQNTLELIRIALMIETLAEPLKQSGFESLLVYAWGLKELAQQEKISRFDGLIQLSQNPEQLRREFTQLLQEEQPFRISITTTEINFKSYFKPVLNLVDDARKEARQMNHSFISPEHLLLGIIQANHSAAANALTSSGISLEQLRQEVALALSFRSRSRAVVTSFITPWNELLTHRAKRVLAFAQAEAQQLPHNTINIDHILLGILREGDNLACVVLETLNIDLQQIYTQVLQHLAPDTYGLINISAKDSSFENYTEQTLKALKSAQTEAIVLRHNFIDTGHLLIGILKQRGISSVIRSVLPTRYDDMVESARTELRKIGNLQANELTQKIPFTPRVKKALAYAQEEASQRNHSRISTAHLLLGLLQDSNNVACTILGKLGVSYSKLCEQVKYVTDVSLQADDDEPSKEPSLFSIFSESALQVVMGAQLESQKLGHNFIGTEHILIALINQRRSVAADALRTVGVKLRKARTEVEKMIGHGTGVIGTEIPFTSNGTLVLGGALEEATSLGHNSIDPEHLLLSLLRLENCNASKVLRILIGSKYYILRDQVLRLLQPAATLPATVIPSGIKDCATQQILQVVKIAQDEAYGVQHNFIGTEKILLGLIQEGTSTAAQILGAHGANSNRVRSEIEAVADHGSEVVTDEIYLTPRVERLFEVAKQIMKQLDCAHLSPEHLLLALLYDYESLAFIILDNLGINISNLQTQLLEMMGLENIDSSEFVSTTTVTEEEISFAHFTAKTLIAIRLADEESCRLNLDVISAEHLCLGIIAEGTDVAAAVLNAEGVTLRNARIEAEKLRVEGGKATYYEIEFADKVLRFTRSGKIVLELALKEARSLNHSQVGTGHILLACIRLPNSTTPVKILQNLSVDLPRLHELTLLLLNDARYPTESEE